MGPDDGRRAPLSRERIAREAVAFHEEDGSARFSLRRLAARLGCDPMAVLYHTGSKEGLERAMADAINAELRPLDLGRPWRERLADMAGQHRQLALKYPRCFALLHRFWATGPQDYARAEEVYRALQDAGLDDEAMVDACFGWYAALVGLASAEAGGLLRPATGADLAEVEALPAERFALTRRLLPVFASQQPGRAFHATVDALIESIALRAKHRPA